jgi:hypothetical protein
MSHISGHDLAGYMAVKHLRLFKPLGILTFQGPIKVRVQFPMALFQPI